MLLSRVSEKVTTLFAAHMVDGPNQLLLGCFGVLGQFVLSTLFHINLYSDVYCEYTREDLDILIFFVEIKDE